MLEQLQQSARPLVLAGHGIRQAGAVALFRSWLRWPCVTTHLANDLLPYADPRYIGHCGVRGDRAGNYAVMHADVILVLGCSLHEQTIGYDAAAFAPQATLIHVDPDFHGTLAKSKAQIKLHQCVRSWIGQQLANGIS